MRPSIRSRLIALVRAQWAGLLALFLVIAGGTAYAANTVGSSDIIDESILSQDIKNNGVKSVDIGNNNVTSVDVRDDTLANGGLTGADLQAESIGSSEVADSSIQEGDLAASARGARAYAYVDGAHCASPVALCTVLRSKRVAYAVHVAAGQWCVGVDGIDASVQSSLAVVTPDAFNGDIWARWRQNNSLCVASEFEIQTGNPTNFADASFTIVIP